MEGFFGRSEPDDVGNVEIVHHQAYQVDVIALGLAVIVEIGVGPQIPYVLIHQRVGFGIFAVLGCLEGRAVSLCRQTEG